MARPLRIEYPNAWYHVMNRGRRAEKVFLEDSDYCCFLDLLQESTQMWGVKIAAYCLMPNHYHLLVQTPNSNLSRFMRHLNGVYTHRFNRRHKYDGQLFRGRYKSILVEEDTYLLELLRYIHRNPIRSGVTEKLSNYPWNSHIGYLSEAKKWKWLHKQFILDMIAQKKHLAIRSYLEFMLLNDSKEISRFFSRKNIPSIIGSKDFITWVKKKFYDNISHEEVPEAKQLAPFPNHIKEVVCQEYNVTVPDLQRSRRGSTNEARNVAIYLTRRLCGVTLTQIGQEFNLARYSSVSSVVGRMAEAIARDRKLRHRVTKLERILAKSQRLN